MAAVGPITRLPATPMTTAMYRHIERQIDKAAFGRETSDLERRIDDERNLTRPERIMLRDKLAARLKAIVREAGTP